MSDVVPALGRREECERGGGECDDVVEGARPHGPEEGFQLGERHLDRIEVGTVGRQKADSRAGRLDRRADLGLLVDGEIIEDDDIPRLERRCQHLLHVRAKADGVDRPIEDGRRREPIGAQRGDDRVRLPMAARCVIVPAHAAETAPVAAQEIGRDAAFIEKDVLRGVAERQPGAPAAPLNGDVGSPLFVGVYGFF